MFANISKIDWTICFLGDLPIIIENKRLRQHNHLHFTFNAYLYIIREPINSGELMLRSFIIDNVRNLGVCSGDNCLFLDMQCKFRIYAQCHVCLIISKTIKSMEKCTGLKLRVSLSSIIVARYRLRLRYAKKCAYVFIQIFVKSPISNLMQIRSAALELIHTYRRADGRIDWATFMRASQGYKRV
jgi:hypothetical protein